MTSMLVNDRDPKVTIDPKFFFSLQLFIEIRSIGPIAPNLPNVWKISETCTPTCTPYVILFTGDFNGHCQTWWPGGDSYSEGEAIYDLAFNLQGL